MYEDADELLGGDTQAALGAAVKGRGAMVCNNLLERVLPYLLGANVFTGMFWSYSHLIKLRLCKT